MVLILLYRCGALESLGLRTQGLAGSLWWHKEPVSHLLSLSFVSSEAAANGAVLLLSSSEQAISKVRKK